MASRLPELILFSGRSNPELAKSIANYDGLRLSNIKSTDFCNKEIKTKLLKKEKRYFLMKLLR